MLQWIRPPIAEMPVNIHSRTTWPALLLWCLLFAWGAGALAAPATRSATRPAQPARRHQRPEDLLRTGEYDRAARGYREALDTDGSVSAAIGLANALTSTGRYEEAVDVLGRVADRAQRSPPWHVTAAEVLSTLGRYDEALEHAVRAHHHADDWPPAALVRGRLLERVGRTDEARAVYETAFDAASASGPADAPSLVALGRILDRHMVLSGRRASRQAANILHNYFQRAYQELDASYWPAHVAAGRFLLSKHREAAALEEFDLAEAINPRLPAVHLGRAAVALERYDFERCEVLVRRALQINPRDPEAHVLLARCRMQWRKFGQVEEPIEAALAVNPNHVEALSLLAALKVRTGAEPDTLADRVSAIHPRCAELPREIGRWLAAGRQFDRAEPYYRRAAELAPWLAGPHADLGLLYMQTGREDLAAEALQRAHELDDFRADVVNYLRVLERIEGFTVRRTEHFIIKAPPKYEHILIEPVAAYMERIHPEVCADLGHEPDQPTIIEIFESHAGFSQRISGRGWIGTIGASTGPVIVLTAPRRGAESSGLHNWATVLRHEYTHTVSLAATRNRIPHWLTEALAVWQQADRKNFETVRMLVAATRGGGLLPVHRLDWSFVRPRQRGERSLAYAQAEWILEYVINVYGYRAVGELLAAFADGLSQPEVLQRVLGLTESQLDRRFAEWARGQVERWGFDPSPPPSVAGALAAALAAPDDAPAHARHAAALEAAGRRGPAEEAARTALELEPDNVRALAVLARVLLADGRYEEAARRARELLAADPRSVTAPRVLAECLLERREWSRAIAALELLQQRQPLDEYSYEQLARLYMQAGRSGDALPNLIHLHRFTMREAKYARQIAEIYRARGDEERALAYFREVLYIQPYQADAHEAIAAIELRRGRFDEAIRAVRAACAIRPDSARSWEKAAAVWYRAGRARNDPDELLEALSAARRAVELDPKSRAKTLVANIERDLTATTRSQ